MGMTDEQQTALKAFVTMRLPRSTNAIGAWLRKNYELSYSHSGLIALLDRLGFVYHKPQRVPRKLDEARQRAFIASYEKLLNSGSTSGSEFANVRRNRPGIQFSPARGSEACASSGLLAIPRMLPATRARFGMSHSCQIRPLMALFRSARTSLLRKPAGISRRRSIRMAFRRRVAARPPWRCWHR